MCAGYVSDRRAETHFFSNVWEAGNFLSVFSTAAISRRGNANGCFDSHGQRLKHLFYFESPLSLEPVDFKLRRDIAASAKSTFTQTPRLFSKCLVI